MIAIFKREIKNYLKRPLFWVGILLVIYGVFNTTSPYLMTHYLGQGEKIVNDYPDTVRLGDVYEGYIPANPEKHREIWSGQIKQALIDELEMSDLEAQSVMSELVDMELEEAFVYLEEKYDWYSARYMYEDSAYYKGTSEEINAYLNEKMKNKTFSFYYSRKFADFAGLFMCFFATIMLAVLFLQDTKKHTYELLHTKPITAGKYVLGKVSAGFAICLIALTIINLLFWALCVIYTKDSGFEVRFWDFIVSTVLYILPNMLMIVSVSYVINHCGNGWNYGRLTADGLRGVCTYVSPEEAKPGDLIFFQGTYNTSGASHVGIYVGNNMMIHCGDPIHYSNISTSYWQQHFMCFGRLP